MGIGDWFKRFRSNAEAFEQYREGAGQDEGVAQSQAARAAHEHTPAPSESATRDETDDATS